MPGADIISDLIRNPPGRAATRIARIGVDNIGAGTIDAAIQIRAEIAWALDAHRVGKEVHALSSRRRERISPVWRICAFLAVAACFGLCLSRARAEGCNAKNALFVVGKPFERSLADEARRRAGATIVRRIDHGMAYQMEFRADRLDLSVDKKGIVVAIHCG